MISACLCRWAGYLASLPEQLPGSPMFWPPEQLQLLAGSAALDKLAVGSSDGTSLTNSSPDGYSSGRGIRLPGRGHDQKAKRRRQGSAGREVRSHGEADGIEMELPHHVRRLVIRHLPMASSSSLCHSLEAAKTDGASSTAGAAAVSL